MIYEVKGKVINANTTSKGTNIVQVICPRPDGIGSDVITIFAKSGQYNDKIGKDVNIRTNVFIKNANEV
jgi:hypothetical protein